MMKADLKDLTQLTDNLRQLILTATTHAGSGHPTSSLSAVELMAALFFGGTFRYDINHPKCPENDRLIFSKGHATPLFYALWTIAGVLSEEMVETYRQFGSPLEGHPTPAFPYSDAATGSLGQGLSISAGMAYCAKYLDRRPSRIFVLLGDSEMTEGSNWEALQWAAHIGLDNLIGVLDVNGLGQCGETMIGKQLEVYQKRISAFGWDTLIVDGHSIPDLLNAFETATRSERPFMIIAETIKGKGISFLENKTGWHGKALDEVQLQRALNALGPIDHGLRRQPAAPPPPQPPVETPRPFINNLPTYRIGGDRVATRDAYGHALKRIYSHEPHMVVLDAEVGNSTRSDIFKKAVPDRFLEMYIAEQNMVGVATGLAICGKKPFVSTFAAFLTRAFDQIRMAGYSGADINFCGSHCGVSIGADGPSQMGLEDIAMFRTLLKSTVLYPSDAVSTDKLVEAMAAHPGICYLRTTRGKTPILYNNDEPFPIGGSKTLRQSDQDQLTLIGAGITLHEALDAYEILMKKGIVARVIDLYSIKPLDTVTLVRAATETALILTVEDHAAEGGIGEAVASALCQHPVRIHSLAVRNRPISGSPEDLLGYEMISSDRIAAQAEAVLATSSKGALK
jgi:transketolase